MRSLLSLVFVTQVLVCSWSQSSVSIAGRGPAPLVEKGEIVVGGHATPYIVRHLPANSFPSLPQTIQQQLEARGCLIPQTYEAHWPENVVHGSFQGPGTSDWALLCSVQGTVSLLVFFEDGAKPPIVLASAPETERLQAQNAGPVLGFNWGIDAASPKRVAEAETRMSPRPAPLDHDALADSVIEHKTAYHFYENNAWTLIEVPE